MMSNRPMMLFVFALAGAVVLIPQPASAQAGCEAIIKAMNAEMNAPAWHRTAEVKTARASMKIEIIKADGQLFRRVNDGVDQHEFTMTRPSWTHKMAVGD